LAAIPQAMRFRRCGRLKADVAALSQTLQ